MCCGLAGPVPALRVVSFHADDTNRAPAFDMDLTELMKDGQPITYSDARQYFKSDPATRYLHTPAAVPALQSLGLDLATILAGLSHLQCRGCRQVFIHCGCRFATVVAHVGNGSNALASTRVLSRADS